jgi:hypothetical protein
VCVCEREIEREWMNQREGEMKVRGRRRGRRLECAVCGVGCVSPSHHEVHDVRCLRCYVVLKAMGEGGRR